MSTTQQIQALASYLEGEGSFFMGKDGCPAIQFVTTDFDVAKKYNTLLGGSLCGPYKKYSNGHQTKSCWNGSLRGVRAIAWMETILVLMGERRGERIRGIIKEWADPVRRARIWAIASAASKKRWNDPELKSWRSAASKKLWLDQDLRSRMSRGLRRMAPAMSVTQ